MARRLLAAAASLIREARPHVALNRSILTHRRQALHFQRGSSMGFDVKPHGLAVEQIPTSRGQFHGKRYARCPPIGASRDHGANYKAGVP